LFADSKKENDMADQAALEQKYASVGQVITNFAEYGAKIDGIFMDGDKLVLKATVPSKTIGNLAWDATKAVDPSYPDFELQLTQTGGDNQPYTIKSGDNLSKVSKLFYGDAAYYSKIAEASGIDNPDHIQVGQEVQVPPLG
jgi:nucleoid-associated protein YgaU